MPLSSRSHPRTGAQIGSVFRGQCHIYQNPTQIRLSLFKESQERYVFPYLNDKISRGSRRLSRPRYPVWANIRQDMLLLLLYKYQTSRRSIFHPPVPGDPTRAPYPQTSKSALAHPPRPDLQTSIAPYPQTSGSPLAHPSRPELHTSRSPDLTSRCNISSSVEIIGYIKQNLKYNKNIS
ncbi:putative glycerophosphoryl diester phosphodiesterase 2 [Dorcoceras hygrometricum]|uniref:Putative glycerophosphoryl diester phosphodiesterase 2 n=1 Tax=Dorcoceras hygrometricum TaxID=472368 RepID=A0A2Z6ZXU3_9LAMI|nr:putative glycerophosphoryl diester phosphodiesterase 2 [Dorcoceras hygrometricum]